MTGRAGGGIRCAFRTGRSFSVLHESDVNTQPSIPAIQKAMWPHINNSHQQFLWADASAHRQAVCVHENSKARSLAHSLRLQGIRLKNVHVFMVCVVNRRELGLVGVWYTSKAINRQSAIERETGESMVDQSDKTDVPTPVGA